MTAVRPLLPSDLQLARALWQWEPHSDGQREFILASEKVVAASCGRRWGKSEATAVGVLLWSLVNAHTEQIVLAPTADQTQIIMGEISRRLSAIPGMAGSYTERRSPYWEITFNDGQGLTPPTRIISRTVGTKGRGLRGRKAHRVIADEAAYISDAIMQQVVGPLLADYDGQLLLISTPDGRNHFWKAFQQGVGGNPRYRHFQFPTASNPYIPPSFLEAERATKPEQVFRQEYEAAFLDREGTVFRKVMAAARLTGQAAPQAGYTYIMGVDWARSKDFTVLAVFDATTRELAALDRFNQIDFSLQRGRLKALHEQYGCVAIVAESNSIGQPNIEALQTEGIPVYPFLTTNATKAALVDLLALSLERQDIAILNDPVLTGELMAYEGRKLPSGRMQYGAPEGEHDDTVMALMLALWGSQNLGATGGMGSLW